MFAYLENIDRFLLLWINSHHHSIADYFMFYISELWTSIPLFAFWLFLIFKKYQSVKKIAFIFGFIGLLLLLTDQSSNQVKHAVKRYRPSHNLEIENQVHSVYNYKGGQYGFFSSHAANTFGVATFLFLFFYKKNNWFKSQFFIWPVLISYSRIYLGVHYPFDILVGMLDGILFGYLVFKLAQLIFKNKFNEQFLFDE